ncbi:MAG: hypothetical protein N2504_05410 [candidate division WOR-3 bacterium]|nr:hypothetical protein [candidate division WOR-3 bacterium]MCX7948007.1 hypothetical protein [candidate division WOR-3 bacterium]MDW8151223.1 choice-of-anchor V domain-containing protein [candidate division WOR-3 bacterium]
MIFLLISNSTYPPDSYCGDPPSNRYCTICHSAAPLNPGGSGSVYFNKPSSYVPGNSYDLNIVVKGHGNRRFGFQMIIKDVQNNPIGSFQTIGPNTRISAGGYATHQNAPVSNDSFVFKIRWIAPSNYSGKVYVYLVGNVANNNGAISGDSIYAIKDSILSVVNLAENDEITITQNSNSIHIKTLNKVRVKIDFYSIYGRRYRVFDGYLQGEREFKLHGIGFLSIKYDDKEKIIKILR